VAYKPTLTPLTTAQAQQIDNKINPRKVTGWKLVGGAFQRGRRVSGFTHLDLEGGGFLYFPESVSLAAAVDEAERRGFLVADIRAKIDLWLKTGRTS